MIGSERFHFPAEAELQPNRGLTAGKAPVPSYRQLYGQVLNGAIAAERRHARWYVSEKAARDLAKRLLDGRRA